MLISNSLRTIFFDLSESYSERKAPPLGGVFCCEEIQLELHCFPKLRVCDMDIQPSDGLADSHGINSLCVLLVLEPRLSQKRTIWNWYSAEHSVELTMPHNRYRTNKSVADSLSVTTAPISPLVTDMMAILSSNRRSSSASFLLLAHDYTPCLSKNFKVL